ncbi:MFS transporter [Dolichospermum sp. UHCC 0684]|uniref:MFS transporter n=1 Tax=unclassified Dolichospermum TaxID=2622029 RepID=UPI00144668EB|nr:MULTISPECIES: MFS transporter [unclassified Dolichospermum]MEA5529792.1 MFS transporter [Dolichospermum sp. UHCC 0684]MTJ36471.1 MFS transporter [Dolichospermum sp. UHCC 0260]
MMQSSDLDKKGRTHSPSDAKKKHKASDHNVASSPKVSHIHSPEMSLKDVSENGNCTSEIPLTDIPKPSKIPQTNGKINGVSENVPTTTELTPETLPLIDAGSGGADSENNQQVGFLPVLKNPNFLALWAGQVFCQLADKVYLVLMIALINSQFQASDQSISGWVSALMMAFTIPAVLFGSVAGVFVDRWSKKVVLVASNIWRGILVLLIPSLLWLTHDWQPVGVLPVGFLIILGVTFLVSTLTQFFAPAEQSAIPLIVKEQDLLSANSLYTTTMMASVIVGFAVGEPVLALADGLWMQLGGSGGLGKEILVGGSYAIAGLILFLLQTNEKPHPPETEFPHVFSDLRDGLRYLQENHRIRNALLQLIILFSVFAALTVLAVRMAEIIPNMKASQFGFLLASAGVGVALGATILGQFGQRFSYKQLSFWGCLGMAASLIGLSLFTTQLLPVLLFIALVGVFGALVGIPMQTAIQTETPPDMRGKVFGLQNNVINIALSLPLALAGVAETFIGLKAVFFTLAAIVLIGGLFTWYNSGESSNGK